MVWRIFKFFERFEYTHEAYKKKPLDFVKSFVGSGTKDISAEYFRQIQDLRLYPDYLSLKGMFSDIRDISANAGVLHRGYLLDGMHQPATSKLIGSWVGLDAKAAGKALKKLEKVGLIERVELPDFDTIEPPEPNLPKPPKTAKQIAAEKKAKAKAKRDAKKAEKTADNSSKAENSEAGEKREKTGKNYSALKNGKNGKTANGNTESKAASGKTANAESEIKTATALTGQGKGKEPQPGHHPAADAANRQGLPKGSKLKTGSQGASDDAEGTANCNIDSKQPAALSTAPPLPLPPLPTEADGSHSGQTEPPDGSPVSTEADGGAGLGDRAAGSNSRPPQHYDRPTFKEKYDPRCVAFAGEIYQAIFGSWGIGSSEGCRELGTFASQWFNAQHSAIGDEQLDILWGKGIEKAKQLGRKRRMNRGAKKPGAVWVTIFKGVLDKMVIERGTAVKVPKVQHA